MNGDTQGQQRFRQEHEVIVFTSAPQRVLTPAAAARLALVGDRLPPAENPVVLVRSDLERVDQAVITFAFRALRWADVVVGPAVDDSCYLIGVTASGRSLLDRTAWQSAGSVIRAMQLARAERRTLVILPPFPEALPREPRRRAPLEPKWNMPPVSAMDARELHR